MRSINATGSVWVALFAGAMFGCSAGMSDSSTGAGNVGGSDEGGSAPSSGGNGSSGGSTGQFNPQGGGTPQPGCDSLPSQDSDMDGFTGQQGDCNDCDANVNPGAIEVIGTADDGTGGGGGGGEYVPADEDCDGTADNVPEPCDASLAMEGTDPYDGARAIELCKSAASDQDWGVVNAAWVRANGVPASVNAHMGILPDLGPNVPARAGARVLGISSGSARRPGDPGYVNHTTSINGVGTAPPGFPQDVPGCAGSTNINDDVALELSVRAPTNATGYGFDFKFYSNEYPEWVCTSFNDQFIALVNPAPMGSLNGNISFDSMTNPVSVNVAFFDVCQGCTLGTTELQGSGFAESEGGTSWLQTVAPIGGGETFSIRFAIWDTGDTAYDSTTIIDNFQWVANGGTVTVGTNPVPE
jgi:hypothetical protein